jgi:hypothetical protein
MKVDAQTVQRPILAWEKIGMLQLIIQHDDPVALHLE